MKNITFNNRIIAYDPDKRLTLLEILRKNEIFISAECGGNKTCGKCMIRIIHGEFLAGEDKIILNSENVLACDVIPSDNCIIEYLNKEMFFSDTFQTDTGSSKKRIGIAVDLGTTALALYYYDLVSGKILSVKNSENHQRSYGADVMSRLKYYSDEPDKNILTEVILNQINLITNDTLSQLSVPVDSITRVVIAGNTVMEHFAAGVDPSGIGEAPYTPATLFGIEDRAADIGIKSGRNAAVYFAPCVSGFVGGDITAGMMYNNIDKISKNILYIDIGTNGEIALKANGKIFCCATAAGPAFEGANISCGTCVKPGAISEVFIKSKNLCCNTIEGAEACGICGSGIIDAAAAALELGLIDETGKIVKSDRIYLSENIFLNQKDIREIQLAKSAIAAGIMTLIECAEISPDDVSEVIIAGGFGSNINISSALKIGLIPDHFKNRITAVGNSSGKGASFILLNPDAQDRVQYLADKCEYIELSESPFFGGEFVSQMMF